LSQLKTLPAETRISSIYAETMRPIMIDHINFG
jgi:hypothetical protein